MALTSTSYKKMCEQNGLKFVRTISDISTLQEDEYYALMVTDYTGPRNPHVIGQDPITLEYLVGIERPNKNCGVYISKDFYSRKNNSIGTTFIVSVEDVTKYTLLSKYN